MAGNNTQFLFLATNLHVSKGQNQQASQLQADFFLWINLKKNVMNIILILQTEKKIVTITVHNSFSASRTHKGVHCASVWKC